MADGPTPGQGASPAALERALEQLTAAVQARPDDPHSLFDLAQTCFELGLVREDQAMLLNALERYQTRAEMEDGWAEEAYHAQHQVGVIAERIGDWPLAIDAYMRAWELRPQRLESVQRLTTGLRERQLYHAAHRFARIASRLRPLPIPDDTLFVAPWVYEWGLLFEYAITSYWVGEYRNAINACRSLLGVRSLPEAEREQTQRNLAHATREDQRVAERARSSRKRQIKATGSNTKPRAADRGLGVPTGELVARATAQLQLSEAEVRRLLRERTGRQELDVPGFGTLAIRSGGRDLLTLVQLLEKPAQLTPTGLASADAITVLGAGSGLSALFLGRLYPYASVQVVSAEADDAELCVANVRALGERATVGVAAEQSQAGPDPSPRAGPIDLLRVEVNGLNLLEADSGWLDHAERVAVVSGPEGPGTLLAELRARGFDARIGPDGEVTGRRAVTVEGT